uniref:Uncharacterized protein n=1 Tax=Anguilla anguilla TaxID=7936 RepID=A0A0E9XSU2_ANGAN
MQSIVSTPLNYELNLKARSTDLNSFKGISAGI